MATVAAVREFRRAGLMAHYRPRALQSAIALGCLLALAPSAASPQTPAFDDRQRQAIGEIVRDYLVKNPEVLQEALAELERRTEEAQKAAQADALQIEWEKLHNSGRDYVIGNPRGDVTLVEFLDYNCGYCKKAVGDIKVLVKSDPKLRVVLKDFPVLGPGSVEASRVALAAKPQLKDDKLYEYHTRLMDVRGPVNGERAKTLAREMGLDMARLERDLAGGEGTAAIQENVALGDKLGLTGTPAFIIGEEIIPGAVGVEPLRRSVVNMRSCGKATC
jgi:protein-disulfide isomerase